MHMPGELTAPALCRMMREALPDSKIVIVTAFDSSGEIRDCLVAGADGCLLKDTSETDMAAAMRATVTGATALDPRIAFQLARDLADEPSWVPSTRDPGSVQWSQVRSQKQPSMATSANCCDGLAEAVAVIARLQHDRYLGKLTGIGGQAPRPAASDTEILAPQHEPDDQSAHLDALQARVDKAAHRMAADNAD
jgi:CheY-like chemotaxis protein